ncbi:MAG: zinc-dependent metalloprotease [Myxococcaceae bacterium]|nr:zinc-dependent metalloprotease [Myxococcaceae bacterium]
MPAVLAVGLALSSSGCGQAELTMPSEELSRGVTFVKVAHQGLSADGGTARYVSGNNQNFYVAINKAELGNRWFLSAYLSQWHPSQNVPMRSLGTKVVSFKVQNGKLFVFDATDGKAWSDTLDPSVVVEAYPVITNYAPFNSLSSSSNYVLFDPSAGLNRFDVLSDDFAQGYSARFEVELAYLQNFKTLADGMSFEEVFTGYTELPGPGILAFEQPFRGSGTLGISLRRYSEGDGFTPREALGNRYFASQNVQYVKNGKGTKQLSLRWNVHPGMTPIPWRLSKEVAALAADPRLAGIDVAGAMEKGIESWNQAFGYPVFQVVPTAPEDSLTDDDKNFVVYDPNPSAGYAFANWRENPNTGEIRGASVYFSATFLEAELAAFADAGSVDAGTPVVDAGTPSGCRASVVVSQVFTGNVDGGAYGRDYIELHNTGAGPVDLTGWSLQTTFGTVWNVLPLRGTVPPGGYYLVGMMGTGNGQPLPLPDLEVQLGLGTWPLNRIALVHGTTALTSKCPSSAEAVDVMEYGTGTATCAFGLAPNPPITHALHRFASGGASCLDTDAASDWMVTTASPRNTSSPRELCSCSLGTAPPSPLSLLAADAGEPTPAAPPSGRLVWAGASSGQTCAGAPPQKAVTLPLGMTPARYIETEIAQLVAHEIGHTLGLRHNFKGSLTSSSVMDYLTSDADVALGGLGQYDLDAIHYLYGQTTFAPPQPFCTDEGRVFDPQCDLFDTGADPLHQDVIPTYAAKLDDELNGVRFMSYRDVWRLSRYVRGSWVSQAQLDAFNAMLGPTAPPVSAALTPAARASADAYATFMLENLFLDPVGLRDEVRIDPPVSDPAFRARVVGVAKDVLLNSDGVRSYRSRRAAADVLRKLQHQDAYQALLDARARLQASRVSAAPSDQLMIDDLLARILVLTTPYFAQ